MPHLAEQAATRPRQRGVRLRGLLVIVLAASVAVVPAAAGQTSRKPCTPLLLDPRDDLEAGLAPGAPDRPDLDILAVDLGADDDMLIVSLAMAAPPAALPAPAGLIDVLFEIGPTAYNAYKYAGVDGTIYGFNNSTGGHVVTGTTDPRTGLVRIRVPRQLIGASARDFVRDVGAYTDELLGTSATAIAHPRDTAAAGVTYSLGSRGCL